MLEFITLDYWFLFEFLMFELFGEFLSGDLFDKSDCFKLLEINGLLLLYLWFKFLFAYFYGLLGLSFAIG